VTGDYEAPDEARMAEMEAIFMPDDEDRGDFRRGLIASVGAYRLDRPGETTIEYLRIFPDQFRRLRDHYYAEQKKQLQRVKENVLRHLAGDDSGLSPKEVAQVEAMVVTMTGRYHYCRECAKDAIVFLMQRRYSE